MQPIRVQILTMSHILKKIVILSEADFHNNLLEINRLVLEIEIYLDQLRLEKIPRNSRLTLNKFEKDLRILKIDLFLREDIKSFKERALSWIDVLQIRSKVF